MNMVGKSNCIKSLLFFFSPTGFSKPSAKCQGVDGEMSFGAHFILKACLLRKNSR